MANILLLENEENTILTIAILIQGKREVQFKVRNYDTTVTGSIAQNRHEHRFYE